MGRVCVFVVVLCLCAINTGQQLYNSITKTSAKIFLRYILYVSAMKYCLILLLGTDKLFNWTEGYKYGLLDMAVTQYCSSYYSDRMFCNFKASELSHSLSYCQTTPPPMIILVEVLY